jgi:hypothetical protein
MKRIRWVPILVAPVIVGFVMLFLEEWIWFFDAFERTLF